MPRALWGFRHGFGLAEAGLHRGAAIGSRRSALAQVGVNENGGKAVTRVELYDAVHRKVGLSRSESSALVELVLKEISGSVARGETVKLSTFGTFNVRQKREQIGRNPKTGAEVPISPRRVIVFKASAIMKQQINGDRSGVKESSREQSRIGRCDQI